MRKSKCCSKLGVVAHTCIPRYSGERDLEDRDFRPVWAKSPQDPISTNKKLGVVTCTCYPSYRESITRRTVVQAAQAAQE
jgi:hypothetical protein